MIPKKTAIPIKTLLDQVLEDLKSAQQWADHKDFDVDYRHIVAHKHLVSAAAIIEVVEVYDCGSAGGFGEGQLISNGEVSVYMDIYYPIFARFLWLYEKYVKGGVNKSALIPREIGGKLAQYWKRN